MDRTHSLTVWAVYVGSLLLASYLGYTVAVAQGAQSAVVITGVAALLVAPMMLRGHQAALLFCWNSTLGLHLLPTQMPAWLLMGVVTLGITALQRALNRQSELNVARTLTTPMLIFSGVVVATMLANGGLGVQWMGSGELAGGRKYLYILGAVLGYFAISLQAIPRERAALYGSLFFLGGLTGFVGPLGVYLGGPFQYLMMFFSPVEGVAVYDDSFRVKGMSYVGNALFGVMLARYGFGGTFHTRHFWRPLVLLLAMVLGLISGYRNLLVMYGGTLGLLFLLEGWHRTKWLAIWVIGCTVAMGVLYSSASRLPTPVQRALAVIPLMPVSSVVRLDAAGTIEWRQELWQALLQDVPRYLWVGKGLTISSRDMEWAETLARFGGKSWDYAYVTGEHHNGFLSVIISFGIWGLLAFLWLLGAGLLVLWRNWKHGRPDLVNINALLLCIFVCWILLFFSYWGTLYWLMRDFMGILGLSVALNYGVASNPRTAGTLDERARD